MYFIGLDQHWRTSTYCILDEHGREVKTRTLRGGWDCVIEELGRLDRPFAIVYEASCGYGELHRRLSGAAERVVVAHPGRLRLIFRSKRKNDRVDARKLAKLLFLDEVPQVHVPRRDVRSWRELIEFRRRKVDERTRVKNGIRSLLKSYGIAKPRQVGGLWTRTGRAWLAHLAWPTPSGTLRCEMLLEDLERAEDRIRRLTAELDRIARDHPGVALLRTIPGVGPRTAEAVVAYVDDPRRFARNRRIGAYLGLVPSQDASAGVNRLGHITKEGPGTVRKLLVEAAWQGIRRDDHLGRYFERIAADKKERRRVALIAVAHHLARSMLAMLTSGETWNPPEAPTVPAAQAA